MAPGLYTATLTVTDNAGLLASATAPVTISSNGNARLDARNQTGGGGENPLSRNFNWTLPLVNLPGRAGLDLSLSLSYNSLVWTKTGSYISFDDDYGFPSAGFGLPVYVVTRNAIWKAVPNAKDPVQVAGKDWWKPSEKAKVKCK